MLNGIFPKLVVPKEEDSGHSSCHVGLVTSYNTRMSLASFDQNACASPLAHSVPPVLLRCRQSCGRRH